MTVLPDSLLPGQLAQIPNNTNAKWWKDAGLRRLVFWQTCILVSQMTVGYDESVTGSFQAMKPWVEGEALQLFPPIFADVLSHGQSHIKRHWSHHSHRLCRWIRWRFLRISHGRQIRQKASHRSRLSPLRRRRSTPERGPRKRNVHRRPTHHRLRNQLYHLGRPQSPQRARPSPNERSNSIHGKLPQPNPPTSFPSL